QVFAACNVIECRALLARQGKAARFRCCQSSAFVMLTNAVVLTISHRPRCAFKPRLDLNHAARCEAVFAAPVLPQRD
ncbi:hypothetical protein ABTH30_24920, partial [Acinetobacter baumannii]